MRVEIWVKYRRILICAIAVTIFAIIGFLYADIKKRIPNEIKLLVSTEEEFDFNLPMKANIEAENIGVLSVNNEKVPSESISIDLNEPFSICSEKVGEYKVNIKLFGFLDIKEISLNVIDTTEVIPCGTQIGIYVKTDGVLVLGNGKITGMDGISYEPSLNKLKSGDYILGVNGHKISNKSNLIEFIQNCQGNAVSLEVRRKNEIFDVMIEPVKSMDQVYKIGVWIRDDTQGIGTLTFVTGNGQFGALGHGITDIDTGLLMEIENGILYQADILSIVKGKEGEPGELVGIIHQDSQSKLGEINTNTNQGIFGRLSSLQRFYDMDTMQVGLKQEIQKGPATILCYVNNAVEEYEIEIIDVDISNRSHNKGMVIRITDEYLLAKTGGIVQGMSGSPIIQNNKLIGAVTHVFIQDSKKGYGTFIENMLNNLE